MKTENVVKSVMPSIAVAVMSGVMALFAPLPLNAETGWLPALSDETGARRCLFADERVTQVRCEGRFCDDIEQYCQALDNGQAYREFNWSWRFSDETGAAECRFGAELGAMTGMYCSGDFCDTMQMECGRLWAGGGFHSCRWTEWVSEEGDANVQWPVGNRAARAAQCSGDYCDAMRFLVCTQS